jgi:citrate synthase
MYHSKIWYEQPEPNDPFSAKNCFCHGYDVFEDILPNASWSEYLYLIFKGERPSPSAGLLLEKLAVAVANPGLRDNSVRAAMNAGVGGSTAASSLIAALGVGAGQFGGAREIYSLVSQWEICGTDLEGWQSFLLNPNSRNARTDIWKEYDHSPGFNPNAKSCSNTTIELLEYLCQIYPSGAIHWLREFRSELEQFCEQPMSTASVFACAFHELKFSASEAEMLYLILRLPGAAAHSLEQKKLGWKQFPFFGAQTILTDDPGKRTQNFGEETNQ